MDEFPFQFKRVAESTWAYLSSLLMLALFFKFNRFWSVRNFDLFLIILLAPGILMIQAGNKWDDSNTPPKPLVERLASETTSDETSTQAVSAAEQAEIDLNSPGNSLRRWGYFWLFGVGLIFLIRMLLDPMLVRRPVLEPNLSVGGLTFLSCALMMFLFANIITSTPTEVDLKGAQDAVKMLQREAAEEAEKESLTRRGPGYTLFNLFPVIPSFGDGKAILEADPETESSIGRFVVAAKSLAIASQVLLVIGLVFFGSQFFNSFRTGIGMAVIYLMLPYSAVYTGYVLHTLPATLMVWALVAIRRPMVSGIFIGLAIGVSYYPIFLLPLWVSFFWEKGLRPFLMGALIAVVVCVTGLIFTSASPLDFLLQLQAMFGFWIPRMEGLDGIWSLGWDQSYRLPILVTFVALCVSFAAWPQQKTVAVLMSYTCVIMIGVQFWHGYGGGEYMAWWIPMALMTIFRPNMEGRVANFELTQAEEKRMLKATRDELVEQI